MTEGHPAQGSMETFPGEVPLWEAGPFLWSTATGKENTNYPNGSPERAASEATPIPTLPPGPLYSHWGHSTM